MKTILRFTFTACAGLILVQCLPLAAADAPPPKQYQPKPDEFSDLGQAVLELLKSGASVQFANQITASVEDRKSILSTNRDVSGDDPSKSFPTTTAYEKGKVQVSAQTVLARAASLHLDFSKGDWQPRVIMPKRFGSTHFGNLQAENEYLPWVEKVEIVLDPVPPADAATNGEFKLALRGLVKYPAGWRSHDGIQWESFPANVADEKTRRELAILDRLGANQPVDGQLDPALNKLGETLIRFLRDGDTAAYEKDAGVTLDLLWERMQKRGGSSPSRQEFDTEMKPRLAEQLEKARSVLKVLEDASVKLKQSDIQIHDASVEQIQSPGASGSLEGAMGSQFKLSFAVKSDAKSASGVSVAGDYILAAGQLIRFGDEWRVMDGLRWQQLPSGVLPKKVVAEMDLENYVAEHRSLPPGTSAPSIEFVTLDGEKKMKLADLSGKVVVLDFWATWCGPCQQPMADLQKIRERHAGWQDRVAIVPLSIDDTIDAVRKHVDKRGWTNTFNVWADEGGWHSKPATAFRVTGVPTTYIIDGAGKIVTAGHPAAMRIDDLVDSLLKTKKD